MNRKRTLIAADYSVLIYTKKKIYQITLGLPEIATAPWRNWNTPKFYILRLILLKTYRNIKMWQQLRLQPWLDSESCLATHALLKWSGKCRNFSNIQHLRQHANNGQCRPLQIPFSQKHCCLPYCKHFDEQIPSMQTPLAIKQWS